MRPAFESCRLALIATKQPLGEPVEEDVGAVGPETCSKSITWHNRIQSNGGLWYPAKLSMFISDVTDRIRVKVVYSGGIKNVYNPLPLHFEFCSRPRNRP